MNNKRNTDPGNRMRKILYSSENDLPETQLSRSTTRSPEPQAPAPTSTTRAVKVEPVPNSGSPKKTWVFGPPFWTVTGCLSLIVNAVLIGLLLAMMPFLGILQSTAEGVGAGLIGGLHTNFEKLDNASISKVISVDAQIPLNITVPIRETTQITLAERVEIPNAIVQITTGGVVINSNARVTLPAGTPLVVRLNFDVPVETTIPVHLDVPVNIPMDETELHEPFVGLQEVIRPLYCVVQPKAMSLTGQELCP